MVDAENVSQFLPLCVTHYNPLENANQHCLAEGASYLPREWRIASRIYHKMKRWGRGILQGVRLAVVSYPDLSSVDSRWIESIRLQHDLQARTLRAHFTLVFPFDDEPTPLGDEIKQAARGTHQISFEIGTVRVIPDVLTSHSHVFLVPNQGYEEIIALHERLYVL